MSELFEDAGGNNILPPMIGMVAVVIVMVEILAMPQGGLISIGDPHLGILGLQF